MPSSPKSPPAARGRPRKFDRDQALRKAMEVFWVSGFQGGSLHDLSQAMGLAAQSLYAAFGSKEALFHEAIALYLASEADKSWQAFERAPDLQQAVKALLVETVKMLTQATSPRGCLLVLGDKGMAPIPDSVHKGLQVQRDGKRRQLTARLERGLDAGELPASVDVAALATSVFIFMSGLSIETADRAPEARLLAAIDEFMARWPSSADAPA